MIVFNQITEYIYIAWDDCSDVGGESKGDKECLMTKHWKICRVIGFLQGNILHDSYIAECVTKRCESSNTKITVQTMILNIFLLWLKHCPKAGILVYLVDLNITSLSVLQKMAFVKTA